MTLWARILNRLVWLVEGYLALAFLYFGAIKFDYLATRWGRLFPKLSAGQWFRYLTGEPEPLRAVLILISRYSRIHAVLLVCAILTHLVVVRRQASGSVFSPAWPALSIAVTWQARSAPLENKEIEMPREVQI
jgi:hypothetical protein